MEPKCLAYRIYPEPKGTEYFESDLVTDKQIIELFDYCQILEAIINEEGWIHLIENFEFEKLFEFNNISGWIDCESLSEYELYVQAELE